MEITMMRQMTKTVFKRATKRDLSEMEKIRLYLDMHPEVFTEEFMEEVSRKFLNYNTVRKYIKDNWYKITEELIDNITIIPKDENEIKELLKS
jgi:hypothetical protein